MPNTRSPSLPLPPLLFAAIVGNVKLILSLTSSCQQYDYESYGECKEVNFKREQSKENKRDNHDVRCRRYGIITPLEEFHENGTGNLEYQEDDADAKTNRSCSQIDSLKTSSTDAVPTVTSPCGSSARPEKEEEFTGVTSAVEPFSEGDIQNLTGPRKKRVSFLQGPLDPKRLQKGKYSQEGNGCVKEHRDVAQEENRVEHVTTHDDIKSLDDLTCHSEASNKNVTIKPKTMSEWLVDPCLYKVSSLDLIFTWQKRLSKVQDPKTLHAAL